MAVVKSAMDEVAAQGRKGDSMVGHLAQDDMIVPKQLQTPELKRYLKQIFAKRGKRLEQYTAGHEENSVNPKTGQREFGLGDWVDNALSDVGSFVTNAASDVGSVVNNDVLKPIEQGAVDVNRQVMDALKSPYAQPVETALTDVGLSVLPGGASFIPEANAAITSANDLGRGRSLGYSLGQGAITGAESLGAQEAGSALGLGTGNSGFESMLGINGSSVPTSDLASAGQGASGTGGAAAPTGGGAAGVAVAPSSVGGTFDATQGMQNPYSLDSVAANSGADPASLSPGGSPSAGGTGVSIDQMANNQGLSSTGPAATGGDAAAKAPSSLDNFTSQFDTSNMGLNSTNASNLYGMLKANPMSALTGAGLAYDAIKGNQPPKGERQLANAASNLQGQGAQLASYLQNGTLPPGVQASINQTANMQKAQIKSQYAAQGGSGSSAEQADLAAVDQWAQGQGAQTAMQLLNTGINESGLAAGLYQDIAKNAMAQDSSLGDAFGKFAASFGGGGTQTGKGGVTVTVGGQPVGTA